MYSQGRRPELERGAGRIVWSRAGAPTNSSFQDIAEIRSSPTLRPAASIRGTLSTTTTDSVNGVAASSPTMETPLSAHEPKSATSVGRAQLAVKHPVSGDSTSPFHIIRRMGVICSCDL